MIPKKPDFYMPCFLLVEEELTTNKKTATDETVTYNLKVHANATGSNVQTYKLILHQFHKGTHKAYIKILQGLKKVWTQNVITNAQDRAATVHTLLSREALSLFKSHLEVLIQKENANGTVENIPLTTAHVEEVLMEVGRNVFLY